MTTHLRFAFVLATLIAPVPAAARERPQNRLPHDFVYLRAVAPSIAQDMRYASADNFTGRPLPGYGAGECVLRREVAAALLRVQGDLAAQQLGLKVYDCYRPARAVTAMWRWSQSARGGGDKRFYPNEDKMRLFSLGYIASHSRHSAGIAVDLTLVPLDGARSSSNQPRNGPCTAPAAQRAPDNSLDMGTGFDCLDARSATHSAAITRAQARWRAVLKAAMTRAGFRNYFREWWHYEFVGAPQRAYDFPIPPR